MKAWQHFCTITHHKILVMKGCFRVGLYRQGLMHDLSKYGWTEFRVGAKYYQGTRSPNNAEREKLGYSSAWLHHKGRNKHHYEYWIDYGLGEQKGLKEMYDDGQPLAYYQRGLPYTILHKDSKALLETLLYMLAEKGENATFSYIEKEVLKR